MVNVSQSLHISTIPSPLCTTYSNKYFFFVNNSSGARSQTYQDPYTTHKKHFILISSITGWASTITINDLVLPNEINSETTRTRIWIEESLFLIKQFLFLPLWPSRKINNRSKIPCEFAIAKASLEIYIFFIHHKSKCTHWAEAHYIAWGLMIWICVDVSIKGLLLRPCDAV